MVTDVRALALTVRVLALWMALAVVSNISQGQFIPIRDRFLSPHAIPYPIGVIAVFFLVQLVVALCLALLAGPVARFALRGTASSRWAGYAAIAVAALGVLVFVKYGEMRVLGLLSVLGGLRNLQGGQEWAVLGHAIQAMGYLVISAVLVAFARPIGRLVVPREMACAATRLPNPQGKAP